MQFSHSVAYPASRFRGDYFIGSDRALASALTRQELAEHTAINILPKLLILCGFV